MTTGLSEINARFVNNQQVKSETMQVAAQPKIDLSQKPDTFISKTISKMKENPKKNRLNFIRYSSCNGWYNLAFEKRWSIY